MTTPRPATSLHEPPESGDTEPKVSHVLAIYLRDHFAGATAGVALAGRCRRNNRGTSYEPILAEIEREIVDDGDTLRSMMAAEHVRPSRMKSAIGAMAELVARLKNNGRLVRYSPSSRVVEFEALAAGVATKANLWRALRRARLTSVASAQILDVLEDRANAQHARLVALHDEASGEAFGADTSGQDGDAPRVRANHVQHD